MNARLSLPAHSWLGCWLSREPPGDSSDRLSCRLSGRCAVKMPVSASVERPRTSAAWAKAWSASASIQRQTSSRLSVSLLAKLSEPSCSHCRDVDAVSSRARTWA